MLRFQAPDIDYSKTPPYSLLLLIRLLRGSVEETGKFTCSERALKLLLPSVYDLLLLDVLLVQDAAVLSPSDSLEIDDLMAHLLYKIIKSTSLFERIINSLPALFITRRLTREHYVILLEHVLNSKRQFKRLITNGESLSLVQAYYPEYKDEFQRKAIEHKIIYPAKQKKEIDVCWCQIL